MLIGKFALPLFLLALMSPQEQKAQTEGWEFLGEQTLKAGNHKATICRDRSAIRIPEATAPSPGF